MIAPIAKRASLIIPCVPSHGIQARERVVKSIQNGMSRNTKKPVFKVKLFTFLARK